MVQAQPKALDPSEPCHFNFFMITFVYLIDYLFIYLFIFLYKYRIITIIYRKFARVSTTQNLILISSADGQVHSSNHVGQANLSNQGHLKFLFERESIYCNQLIFLINNDLQQLKWRIFFEVASFTFLQTPP